jgi:uncharacterized membrane protein
MEKMDLAAVHRFLARRAFYPLMLCTALCFALLATRFHFSGERRYRFLVWNLFLAWVPYWCSLGAAYLRNARPPRRRLHLALIGAAWLVMFPNAPYIFTDFIHVIQQPTSRWWFDVGLISSYALTGCFLGVVSLRIMHDLVRPWAGEIAGWTFVIVTAGLSGFGIYLGRFQRFNSWDVLLRPHVLLADVFGRAANPLAHPRTLGVTVMFAALILVTYVMFRSTSTTDFAEE